MSVEKRSMSSERWQQLEALFEAALEQPSAQRTQWLQNTCDDAQLREEVERMLAAHERAEGILERPVHAVAPNRPAPDAATPTEDRHVGPYRLVREIGHGGMGVVYEGYDPRLDRPVAIKCLPAHLSADEQIKARFVTEAKAASAIDHPNICTIHDVVESEEGRLFIVMAYYEGQTLKQRIAQGPLSIQESIDIVTQVADGLACAHEADVIHRDIKPTNVMITRRGETKILDFGIAKLGGVTDLTRQGTQLGTLAYMSPEQARGEAVDHRTDLWSLGVVLYEMLAGRRPFDADYEAALIYALLENDPPPIQNIRPDVPDALVTVLHTALQKEADRRYQQAADFIAALHDATTRPEQPLPPPAQPPSGTVTLFFSDIEGSTRLLQQLGARYPEVLADQQRIVRAAIQEHDGEEVDTAGDGIFAAFHRARDAAAAAIAVQHAMAERTWPDDTHVRLRIGLHTGEPLPTTKGYTGLDVHRAARICAAGHGGQVLLSQTTSELVEHELPSDVHLMDLGRHRLKDIAWEERLFQLDIPGLPSQFPPLRTPEVQDSNLPTPLTSFVGRANELEQINNLLSVVRLLTLTGPGGTGKTRLSLQIAADGAHHFDDGVFFVSLAGTTDPDLVPSSIAKALDAIEQPALPIFDNVKNVLQDRHALLVLDNFEHVVAAAPVVADLLAACPDLKVLVTSRVPLRLSGEHELPIPPLGLPDLDAPPDPDAFRQASAVALFEDRAQAARPDFAITRENARAVAELCTHLDGLPLAIELAAARIKLFSPQAMVDRLDRRLDLLKGGARDRPARHQTIRQAIAWSYDLLDDEEQAFFRRLSVFASGCTLEAAEKVANAASPLGVDSLDAIASLVEHSLLRQHEDADGVPCFSMLETIRAFARECLTQTGEHVVTQRAHAEHFLRLATEAAPALTGPEQAAWLDRLEAEHDNLSTALDWAEEHAETEIGLQMSAALWRFWLARGYMTEGRQRLERLLALPGGQPTTRAQALHGLGTIAHNMGDNAEARTFLEDSLALWREHEDKPGMARVLNNLGWVACELCDLTTAQTLSEEALELNQELDEPRGVAVALNNLGWVAAYRGDFTAARSFHQRSLALRRELGDQRNIAFALSNLAWTACCLGDYEQATSLLSEALQILRPLNDQLLLGWALVHQGHINYALGAYEQAADALEESLSLTHEGGNASIRAWTLGLLGETALARGHVEQAVDLLEESLSAWQSIGSPWGHANALCRLARTTCAQGQRARARKLCQKSLALRHEMGDRHGIAECLEVLAELESVDDHPLRAARLLGATEHVREQIEAPRPPCHRDHHDRLVAALQNGVGEHAFADAYEAGRAMTVERAVAYARNEMEDG